MSALTWEPASIITGFRLETPLGSGGFGSVWRAVPEGGGDPVALKLLNGRFSDEDTARMRGDVELLAASASSSSPHIVKVLGGGTDPVPYVVMELIDGTDLGRELDRRARVAPPGRFSQGETIGIARSVASALGVLRATGIIHRDVKPANVMIDKAGVVKLADFGIAKIVGFDSVTATSQLPMSMAYAAPEVWEGHATHQSDLYALGCMLYQCLAGRPPFTGSYAEVFRKHLSAAPDLGALPADIAPSLLELLRLCLMKQGADRPANSDAVLALLECAEREVAARPTSETTVAVVAVPAHEPQGAARRSGDTATSPPNSTS
ncbi:MAG: serine/threonine-protein kinase [Dehalococcoidia bacterium]